MPSGPVSISQAKELPGLRLVVIQGVPSPWSQAAKAILGVKGIEYTLVHRTADDPPGALEAFSDTVLGVAPEATGMAVDVVEFGRVVSSSLGQALGTAAAAIALLVFFLWRRVDDTLLVLAPLGLAGALTGAGMVLAGLSFNFANVIALPLLLGVGVDSAIHLVHRARAGGTAPAATLLATTTARAVFYSFATTLVSFGNLAFSGHRGIASMGLLLGVGLSLALACNLGVLPALIDWRIRPGAR